MSGVKLRQWAVLFDLDTINQTYRVKSVTDMSSNGDGYVSDLFIPYTRVDAGDELDAFKEANEIMRNLGFKPERD